MAMINCPECGKRISSEAISCPSCGYPLSLKTQKSVKEQGSAFSQTDAMNQVPSNESVVIKAKDITKENSPKRMNFSVLDNSYFKEGISSYIGISAGSEKTTSAIMQNGKVSLLPYEYPSLEYLDFSSKLKILQGIKYRFENEYYIKLKGAVITVPNYYSIRDRLDIIRVAKLAGFEQAKTSGNLSASLLSLAFKVPLPEDHVCLLINFDNSYTEATLCIVGDGVFEVLDEYYITSISNIKIRNELSNYINNYYLVLHNIDLSTKEKASDRIKKEANRIFDELNSSLEHHVFLPNIFTDRTGSKDIDFYIRQEDIETIMAKTIIELESFIKSIMLKADSISRVIALGTIARQPMVKGVLKRKLNVEPVFRNDESAIGSALYGGIYSGTISGVLVLEIIPRNIKLQSADTVTEYFVKGSMFSTSKSIFSTSEENQRSVGASIVEELNGITKKIGEISLDNLPPLPKGSQIEVELHIGPWLTIAAKIRVIATGLSKTIVIE